MLKDLIIAFDSAKVSTGNVVPIKYNLFKRLKKLKYIFYLKIDITVKTDKDELQITRDYKIIHVSIPMDQSIIDDTNDIQHVYRFYREMIECLKVIWLKNNWNQNDLENVYS